MERGVDKEGNFGLGFGSAAVASVLSCNGMSLQAGRVNVCLIRCNIDQVIVTFVGCGARGGDRISEKTVLI